MSMWKQGSLGLALLLTCGVGGWAQDIPGVGAPPPPAAAAGVGAAGGAAGGAKNLWSFFCMTPEQKAACRAKLCSCKLFQLLNNSLKPASALTGGIIPDFCPAISPAALKMSPTSAEGAAAQIMKDEKEAKARRAAMRYLGTVDCRWWPEAQEALIAGLRADRNECVRMEAAMSLGSGCCCTKATIKALTIAVGCSDEDHNPVERSPRVRAAARAALEHCVSCYCEITTAEPAKAKEEEKSKEEQRKNGEPKQGNGGAPSAERTLEYYRGLHNVSRQKLITDAKRVLEKAQQPVVWGDMPPSGSRSVFEIITHATVAPSAPTPAPVQAAHQVPAQSGGVLRAVQVAPVQGAHPSTIQPTAVRSGVQTNYVQPAMVPVGVQPTVRPMPVGQPQTQVSPTTPYSVPRPASTAYRSAPVRKPQASSFAADEPHDRLTADKE